MLRSAPKVLTTSKSLQRGFSQSSAGSFKTAIRSSSKRIKAISQPYTQKLQHSIVQGKEASVSAIWKLSDWLTILINKTTGYDNITSIEHCVTSSEKSFEETTKRLRTMNREYLNHEQHVQELQLERSELMMKPKRTSDENKRLAELVATENEWETPLENVRREYLDLFELQKKQLETYKESIYKRYYEERAWEQKIRRLGQYSYIFMLGINLITFGYTRYDRKKIRKNMEYTVQTNNALINQINSIQADQRNSHDETKQLLSHISEEVAAAKKKKIDRIPDLQRSVRRPDTSETMKTVYFYEMKRVEEQLLREKKETQWVEQQRRSKMETNCVILILSACASYFLLLL